MPATRSHAHPRAAPPSGAVVLAATVLGGTLLPAQFATNSALAGALGSVTLAGAVSYLLGAACLCVAVAAQARAMGRRPDWRAARHGPHWAWLGGAFGSAYVVGSVLLTRALGAALATTLVIAAQLVTAVALDHYGALGLARRPVNRARAAAVACALAALGLRLWGARLP